ncbi:MAG: hypothetical protein K2X55_17640 [Burkholderiaceae bacterium]|nr:hypothetical protein [Burkholderiaceae bacterium]
MKRFLTCMTLGLALTGCAHRYNYVPIDGKGSATLTLADERLGFVYLTENDDCPKSRMAAKSVAIPADTRLWVEPGFSSLGLAYGRECSVPMSFVAAAGKKYFIFFQDNGRACQASIMYRDESGQLVKDASVQKEKSHRCIY